MQYELIRPTEDFFSHGWGNPVTEDLKQRIRFTRWKLDSLESKLLQRLDGKRWNPDIRAIANRVSWLRSHIGVWTNGSAEWDAQMLYPHDKMVISLWDETILGEWRKDKGLFVILLSSSTVNWLNKVDEWVSDVASTTTPST